jgi:hypothetical protein
MSLYEVTVLISALVILVFLFTCMVRESIEETQPNAFGPRRLLMGILAWGREI